MILRPRYKVSDTRYKVPDNHFGCFALQLDEISNPGIFKCSFGVIGLGSSAYPESYCRFPILMDKKLKALGADRAIPLVLADELNGQAASFAQWTTSVLSLLESTHAAGSPGALKVDLAVSGDVLPPGREQHDAVDDSADVYMVDFTSIGLGTSVRRTSEIHACTAPSIRVVSLPSDCLGVPASGIAAQAPLRATESTGRQHTDASAEMDTQESGRATQPYLARPTQRAAFELHLGPTPARTCVTNSSRENPYEAKLVARTVLSDDGSLIQVSFDITGLAKLADGTRYLPGDNVGVFPRNSAVRADVVYQQTLFIEWGTSRCRVPDCLLTRNGLVLRGHGGVCRVAHCWAVCVYVSCRWSSSHSQLTDKFM